VPGPNYSAETKEQFFDLLDRGGATRAAARGAGVHLQAAHHELSSVSCGRHL
jgi:IS30 family transposase